MFPIIVCVIVILILIYIILVKLHIVEGFGDEITVKKTHDILDLSKQFDDLITYENDADGRIGLDKCIENCNGYCVEYGLTGVAHCFPARDPQVKNFDGLIVQNDRKLSFPNIE